MPCLRRFAYYIARHNNNSRLRYHSLSSEIYPWRVQKLLSQITRCVKSQL
ncbi:hypothetical protein HMPREF1619_04255 [Klebsiella pneumoniae 909957]|nr:hypothetical protein HMPREF1619_04255 [Klebsiella pneumoniae 909957]KXA25635.1 hypothetical protein HMPREF3197_02690 [Klebsiella pneumoniae]